MMKTIAAASAILFLGSTAYAGPRVESQQSVKESSTDITSEDIHCLALNSYFESRNQSPNGGIAVTHVVLNRVADKRYPNTICDVVKDASLTSSGAIKRNKCQFSWYCDGLSDKPRDNHAWLDALNRTLSALHLYNTGFDISHGSTHYHSKNVKPYWSTTIEYITTIDDHHFYKWGQPG